MSVVQLRRPTLIVWITLSLVVLIITIWAGQSHNNRPVMNYPTAELAGNAFVAQYEAKHGDIEPAMETWLIHEATLVCTRLNSGFSLPVLWGAGVEDGMSSDMAVTVIESAIDVYCPQSRPSR